jgi:hypothetical protein
MVCHLRKALYGIREAPKAWHDLFTSWLIEFGFEQSLVDPCVFTIIYQTLLYILALYVDDSILVGKRSKFFCKFKRDLSARFKIEDLGPAKWLFGCSIERDRERRTLKLSQSQYVSEILKLYEMDKCSSVGTPMAAKIVTDARSNEPLDKKKFPFPNLIGKLLYCSNCTRPDITVDVNHLSRYMSKPTVMH